MKKTKHRNSLGKSLFFLGALSLLISLPISSGNAQVQQWDFQDSENYWFDAQQMQVSGGSAQLLKRPPYRDEGTDAFERGHFVKNTWAARKHLELVPQNTVVGEGSSLPYPIHGKTPGLAALWHLDEPSGTNILDSIGRNVAKVSDANVVSGQTGFSYARLFDGVKSHIFIPYYQSLRLENSFSLEAWIRPAATISGKPQTIVSRWQTVAAQKGFALQIATDGRLDFQVSPDGATTVHHLGGTVLTPGFWYHVTAVYDGTDLRVYLNGVLDSEPTPFRGPVFRPNSPIYVGALVNNRVDEFYEGVIDEVAFYDRALNETETLTHVGNAKGLVAFWNLDERGGVVTDRSGYGHNAVAYGEVTYETEGKFGTAIHFNGDDQYLETADSFHLSPDGSLTLEAWIRPDRLPRNNEMATIVSSTRGETEFSLSITDEGRLRAWAPTLSPSEFLSHTTVMPNVWQHVVVTWGHNSVRLYINGLLDGIMQYEGFLKSGKVGIRIGMDAQDTAPFNGALDQVAVYRRVQTGAEVAKRAGLYPLHGVYESSIKNAGGPAPWQSLTWSQSLNYGTSTSPDARGLIHLYHFDEPTPGLKVLVDDKGSVGLNSVGTYPVTGVFSKARWFSEQDYGKLVSQKAFPKLSTFTVSFWFQFAAHKPGLSDRLFSVGDEALTAYRSPTDGKLHVRMEGARKLVGATAVQDTRWHHLAITSDGQQMFLYLDGVMDGTSPVSGAVAHEPLVLGNLKTSDTFEGAIDEFAVFNYPLSRESVIDQFLTGVLDLKFLVRGSDDEKFSNARWYGPRGFNRVEREAGASSAGLWHFNEKTLHGKDMQVTDATRFAQHGAAYGQVTPTAQSAVHGAFSFNGAGDYIEVPDSVNMHLRSELTLSAWIRPAEIQSEGARILDKRYRQGAPVFSSFSLEVFPKNRLAVRLGRPGGYHIIATDQNGEVAVNRWTHVAATYDGQEVRLYINGQLKKASAYSDSIPYDDGSLFIGRYGNGQSGYFHGLIDEVGLDNRALREDEILGLFLKADPENYYRDKEFSALELTPSKFFQYQAHLSTDYPYVTPSLEWVEIEGSAYATDAPFIINNHSISFADITHFRERTGAENQGGVTYQISNDGRNWFYHNGRHWVIAASSAESNTASQIQTRIKDFPKDVGIGSFYFKAFFHSPTGIESVQLDAIEVEYLPNKLTVTGPNGTEAWLVGSEQVIRWNSAGEVRKVRIEYSSDNFKKDFNTIAKDFPNQGAYTWEVPDKPGTQYRIRVADALDPRIYDTSDISFRIVGALEVVTPNFKERLKAGETVEIEWRTMGGIRDVKLDYSLDNFEQQVYPIVDSVKNTGKYSWQVPDHISTDVKVRVSDVNDALVDDKSNDVFTIHGEMRMLAPEAGKRWLVGSEQEIRWQTVGTIPAVKIEYAVAVPGEDPKWKTIEDIYSNRGSYVWRVPDEIARDVFLRVSDPNDSEVVTQSNPVSITGGLRFLTPKGQENWTVGSRRKIAWQSIGTIPSVTLEYALLDEISNRQLKKGIADIQADLEWIPIAEAVPNIDNYVWKIPDSLSEKVTIRVTDARDPFVYAFNSAPFHIIPGFELISPNGSEGWSIGSEQLIEWNTLGSMEHVTLEYSKDRFASDSHTIIKKASNVGRFLWEVPDDTASEVWIRIMDPERQQAQDMSDAPFRIFGTFKILSPIGGEKFEVGSLAGIHWETLGTISEVTLEYSRDDFVKDIRMIADSIPNRGQYEWTVPDDISAGYSLRITDASDPQAYQISEGPFSIVGSFHLVNPVAGQNYVVGTLLDIRWKGAASVPFVRIDYSEDDFTKSFNTIADAAPNTGSFKWEIPNRIGQHFKLRIWDPADPESMTIMEESSRVVGGFMLHSPNGGEILYVGESAPVTWQSYGTLPRIRLEFSDDNFTHNIWEVADAYENIGRYQWNVPDLPSGKYKLRISDPEDATAYDISNSNFRIRPRIKVLSPTGGERWSVGEKQTIRWQTSGSVSDVVLEYSTDDFQSIRTIAEGVPNTGSYDWVVPDKVSANLKVRVLDTRDPGALGVSGSSARIQGILNVLSPNGGEVWKVGQAYPINWSTEGSVKGVRLEYSRDAFQSEVEVIVESMVNSGTYNWTVPDDIAENVMVRVVDVSDGQSHDVSNNTFQIAPSFMVIGPNGKEKWHATEKREISWVTIGTVSEVNLNVCKVSRSDTTGEDCFASGYTVIDEGIHNQGRYIWDIPRVVGSHFKVQVCDARFRSVCDESDDTFSIESPFEFANPRLRESWLVGSDQELRWHTYGHVPTVLLEYVALDSAPGPDWDPTTASWKVLEKDLTNKGYYLFNVPDDISKHVTFRISDWTDEALYSLSKEPIKFSGATTVLSPNGGEAWAAGSTQPIIWETTGSISNVRLEYSQDDFQADVNIIEGIYPNTGRYDWVLSHGLSANTRVRIADASDPEIEDLSDNPFKVMAGFILHAPNGGERWDVGSQQTIRWKSLGDVDAVRIEYRATRQATPYQDSWKLIGGDIPDTGEFIWQVPNDVSAAAEVRIRDVKDPDSYHVSANPFEIKPSVIVAAPSGGEALLVGVPYEVRWMSVGTVGDVALEYSKDNFETDIQTITARTQNTGSYFWTPTDDVTTQAKLRVVSLQDSGVKDESDLAFKILPRIQVLAPSGEKWIVGSEAMIQWDWRGTLNEVLIEYSLNDFASSSMIAKSVPNTGSFAWQVPDHVYQDLKVKVSDANHAESFGVSEQVGKIIPGFKIISPAGGEKWSVGSSQWVEWMTSGSSSRVVLQYKKAPEAEGVLTDWTTIESPKRNSGRFEWTVPDDVSSKVKLRVIDAMDGDAAGVSPETFKILGAFNFVKPSTDEVLRVGSRYQILWDTFGQVPSVRMEYLVSDEAVTPSPSASFKTIEKIWENTGHYYWTIPDNMGEYVWLKISDARETDAYLITPIPFKIRGDLNLSLSQKSQVGWKVGDVQTINWKTNGAITHVDLEYAIANKTAWQPIATGIANSGSYGWTVPDAVSDQVKIRIRDTNNPNIVHEPLESITIAAQFEMTSPKQKESFVVGEEIRVAWKTIGQVNKVWLEYSTGDEWHAIAGPMPNVGSHIWEVPDRISSFARLRIRDGDNANAFDISEAFQIIGEFKVIRPSGSEVISVDAHQLIEWTTIGTVPEVRLELTHQNVNPNDPAGPAQITVIEERLTNHGSYVWRVPDRMGDFAKIRVSDVRNPSVHALNSIPFSIIGDFDLLSPKGGEPWIVGSTQEIAWSSKGNVPSVAIEYSRDDFYRDVNLIGSDLPNTGLALWTIPDSISDNVKVRISDFKDPRANSISEEPFKITGAFVVTIPGHGEVWNVGDKKLISWLTTGTVPRVRIEYSRDDFRTDIQVIENSLENNGQYEWTVPDIISNTLKLRISDASDASVLVLSEALKVQGALHLTAPVTDQAYTVHGRYPITWETVGSVPKVRIEYSRDNFNQDIQVIAGEVENKGVYEWTVPDDISSGIQLRILDARNYGVADISPGYLEIQGALQFATNFRNQRWSVNSTQPILWSTVGTIPSVRLDYSTDGFFRDIHLIADAVDNNGKFVWLVPDDIASEVTLRISDIRNARVATLAESPLSIVGTLSVITPKGREAVQVGRPQIVQWETVGTIPAVRLEYSTAANADAANAWKIITGSAQNTGSYSWVVPDDISSYAKVRVSDVHDPSVQHVSAVPFSIVGHFEFLSPQGGERWIVGTQHEIKWKATGTIPEVKLHYSQDGFKKDIQVISEATPNTGRYRWTLPNAISDGVQIRIQDAANPAVIASPASPISIIGDFIWLKPSKDSVWKVGSQQVIEWESVGSIPEVRLEYFAPSQNLEANNFHVIQDRVPNQGSFTWRVPDRIGEGIKVKIADSRDPTVSVLSPVNIKVEGELAFTAPEAAQKWLVGSVQKIQWNTTGSIPFVALEYSSDDFQQSVVAIERNYKNENHYFWEIPDAISDEVRVRVRDVSDDKVYAESKPVKVEGSLKLEQPSGSQIFTVGEVRRLDWATTGTIPTVKLNYSTDGFVDDVRAIIPVLDNAGQYHWAVPDTIADKVWVRVQDARDGSVQSVLESPVRIQGGFQLINPSGQELLTVGEKQVIRWQSEGSIPFIRLEYSPDGFLRKSVVVDKNIPNTGTYEWDVPDFIQDAVTLRISDDRDPAVYAQTPTPFKIHGSVNLLSLAQDATWKVGSEQTLEWTTEGSIPQVRLEYSGDEFRSDVHVIYDSIPNQGSVQWIVPDAIGSDIRLRISDAKDPEVVSYSQGTIKVEGDFDWLNPSRRETWTVGNEVTLQWKTIGTVSKVALEYSTDGFQQVVRSIEKLLTNENQYVWTIPDHIHSKVQVRVRDAGDLATGSVSVPFEIQGDIAVLSPQADSVWQVGSEQAIQWRTIGNIPQVRIEYSQDRFQSDVRLVERVVNATGADRESYVWKIPDAISDRVWLRVTDIREGGISGTTTDSFMIKGRLEVLEPRTPQVWTVGSEQQITWQTLGSMPFVRLEYSRDGFDRDRRSIVENLENTGHYSWTIPDVVNEQIWVRVVDANDATVWSVTPANIRVQGKLFLESPQGGETWVIDNEHRIEWKTLGSISHVRLEYLVQSQNPSSYMNAAAMTTGQSQPEATYMIIQDRVPNSGSYPWRVPDNLPPFVKLRVVDIHNPAVYDESKTPLKLKGTIEFVSPLQSEKWIVGSSQELIWESRGFMPQVKLEYSRDGFKEERGVIYDYVPNAGSVKWIVPDIIAKEVHLRISDPDNPEVFAQIGQPIEVRGDFNFLYPRGGEQLVAETDEEIRWETIGTIPYVRLEYSRDKFQRHHEVIAEGAPNIGRYVWRVPDDISKDVWLRVSNPTNPEVQRIAEYPISIIGSLYLKKPAGGEIFHVGTKARIKWDTIGSISKVRLEYSTDDFFNAVPMTGAIDNTGSMEWLVPDIISNWVKLRVVDASDPTVSSGMRMPLKVQGGFEFINPKGEEFWLVGSQHVVTWQTFGTIPYVNLEYSMDNFATVTPIILGMSNTDNYTWIIPDITADQIRFRVSSAADQSVYATNPQAIQIGGELRLQTPAGGEVWKVGDIQEIRWRTTGTIPRVRLELSTDQFRKHIESIEASLGNTGFYPWKIPNHVKNGIQVRVSDLRNPRISDTSKGPFKIVGGIQFLYPKGGETWKVGSRQKIAWETIGDIPEVRIEYSVDGFVSTMPIAGKVMNTGSYDWEVPDLSGRALKFRVTDARDPSVYAESTYDVAVEGKLEFISPQGAEAWSVGSQQPIAWRTTGTIPNVNIEYSTNDFRTVESIASGVANSGNYLWTVPSLDTHNLKIRVADSMNPKVHDMIRSGIKVFGKLELRSPAGGEAWVVGTKQPIRWSSTGPINRVRLEYSTTNFRTVFPIVASVTSQDKSIMDSHENEYLWEIPDTISDNIKVRVTDVTNPSVFSEQAKSLEIRGALALTSPTGSEHWRVGARHPISWKSHGTIPQVRLEYSTDNFISDIQTIASSVSNKGVYYWEVPAMTGNQLKVRVTDMTNMEVYDISQDSFYIFGKLDLLFPITGETFQVGERIEIQWKATPNIRNIKLEYSDDDFLTSRVVSDGIPNTGSFYWNVPDVVSDALRLRISDAQNATVFALTRMPFKVQGGLMLLAPRGGEVWEVGTQQTLTWQTHGTIDDVRLEYSSDDFATVSPIQMKMRNTGMYTWSVPEVFMKNIKVRITDANNPFVHSTSGGSVQIVGSLRLVSPNGGERWVPGEERVIKWETIGHVPSVALEYSKDDFIKDIQPIAVNIPNVGSHFWSVPKDRAKNVKVRIRSVDNGMIFSESETPFELDHYKIQWVIKDIETQKHLSGLTFTDSAGLTKEGLTSPVTLDYSYGIYTSVWSKPGFEEMRSTWLADQDRNFQMNLVPTKKVIEVPRVNFKYDPYKDLMKITSWYDKGGQPVPAVTRSEIRIYDGSRLMKTLTSSNPDMRGQFKMVWDTSPFQGNKRYLASASITTASGQTVTSPISFQIDLPVKEQKNLEPRRAAIASSFVTSVGVPKQAPQPVATVSPKPVMKKPLALPKAEPKPIKGPEVKPATKAPAPSRAVASIGGKVVVPDSAVLNETVSVTYISEPEVAPVIDVYDANRKLVVRGQPMQETNQSGQYTYLLPVKGIGFVAGKSIKVVVIERRTGKFQSRDIHIQSSTSALGLDREAGMTTVLNIMRRLDQLAREIQKAGKDGEVSAPRALVEFESTMLDLAAVLTADTIEPTILRKLNGIIELLADVIQKKGYDVKFLLRKPLGKDSNLDDVNSKFRDLQSALAMLNQSYYGSPSPSQGS